MECVCVLCLQEYADLHVVALSVLARCLEDTENMQALQSSGCLNKLLEHIKDSSLAELKQNAVSGVCVCMCVCVRAYAHQVFLLSSPYLISAFSSGNGIRPSSKEWWVHTQHMHTIMYVSMS